MPDGPSTQEPKARLTAAGWTASLRWLGRWTDVEPKHVMRRALELGLGCAAEVVLMETGDATLELAKNLPLWLDVYGT